MYHYVVTGDAYYVEQHGLFVESYRTVQEAVDAAMRGWWRRLVHRLFTARIYVVPGHHEGCLTIGPCAFSRWLPVKIHLFGGTFHDG